ncbi:hypothetical protein FA09DRAFT_333734 [Tilletiopsis washingtonensis]|uniref:Complex 1 LYR protein domain-containing protein n=1 Tax=Tilletiopsis washingtonensis TaxID=58919 RepID=A0A316ZC72_9BASI|nr:hypothetical protein FA09DRAFT_333734 [Tilletiopsis washingtonensis]PWN99300.1 hypothetical protein FA09DRAFT_333734 [Tilletiopsis washingtonensis]
MAQPSKTQILRLYRDYMRSAQSFASYNFRTYFQRRSRDMFRSALLPSSAAAQSSPYSKAGAVTGPASPSTLTASSSSSSSADDGARLAAWYATARQELQVLRRAALTNQMYAGERLVVEQPRPFVVGGGGAGMEASTGGSGMPDKGNENAGKGAPESG